MVSGGYRKAEGYLHDESSSGEGASNATMGLSSPVDTERQSWIRIARLSFLYIEKHADPVPELRSLLVSHLQFKSAKIPSLMKCETKAPQSARLDKRPG